MKKLIICLMLVLFLVGCGTGQYVNGKYCSTYGLLNKEEVKCKNVDYKIIGGNIFWAIAFSETGIVPLYFVCFDLYEPV